MRASHTLDKDRTPHTATLQKLSLQYMHFCLKSLSLLIPEKAQLFLFCELSLEQVGRQQLLPEEHTVVGQENDLGLRPENQKFNPGDGANSNLVLHKLCFTAFPPHGECCVKYIQGRGARSQGPPNLPDEWLILDNHT